MEGLSCRCRERLTWMVTYLLTEYQFLLNEALSALQYQTLNNRIGIKYMCFFSVEPESRRRRLAEKARITELAPLCTYPAIEMTHVIEVLVNESAFPSQRWLSAE